MEFRRQVVGGVEETADVLPDGLNVVDTYDPCATVAPWDYYGGKHQREISMVLRQAGLSPVLAVTRRRILHPYGTGPGGRVRFGDDMCPGTFFVAVPDSDVAAAHAAIAQHKQAVSDWLHNGAPMPAACQG